MRIAFIGSRDFKNKDIIRRQIKRMIELYGDDLHVVSGRCPTGADEIADKISTELEVDFTGYPAKWSKYGKPAGPRRNTKVVKDVTSVFAFYTDRSNSRGTTDTVTKARIKGMPVFEWDEKTQSWWESCNNLPARQWWPGETQ